MLNKKIKYKTRIGRYIMIAVLLYFSIELKNKVISQEISIDYSSPIVKAVLNRQKAIQENNLEEVWDKWTVVTRQEKWRSYEDFKEWFIVNSHNMQRIAKVRIEKIKSITPNRLWVKTDFAFPGFKGFYLIKEREEWRFGIFDVYLKKVKKDMEILNKALMNYFANNKEFPSELVQLAPVYIKSIPFDPFKDEDKPYGYLAGRDWFRLYSVGPDGYDEGGMIEYAPEKGLFSEGDIIEKSESIK